MGRKERAFGLAAMLLVSAAASPLYALTVDVQFDPGTTQQTPGVYAYNVYGDMMDGMQITAYFVAGGSETVSWGTTGAGAGGAFGTGWSLTQGGHSYFKPGQWVLETTSASLARMAIDAGFGATGFDIFWGLSGDEDGTPGSEQGRTFTVTSGPSALDIRATYRDQVAVIGELPVGDLFRTLDIEFLNVGGLGSASLFVYRADTDNMEFLPPTPLLVPEPATVLLIGAAVGLVALRHWRRR